MSDVFYYKGLTCECDASVPRLTIEGRKVPVEIVGSLFQSPESPDDKTETLRKLAEKIVDQSIEFNNQRDCQGGAFSHSQEGRKTVE